MTTEQQLPAFPNPKRIASDPGLSKRQYVATEILTSLVSDKKTLKSKVKLALEAADLLLEMTQEGQ
jgi:hypothetical protein